LRGSKPGKKPGLGAGLPLRPVQALEGTTQASGERHRPRPAALRRPFLEAAGARAVDHERPARVVFALAPAHLAPGEARHLAHAQARVEHGEHGDEAAEPERALLERADALRGHATPHLEILRAVAGGFLLGCFDELTEAAGRLYRVNRPPGFSLGARLQRVRFVVQRLTEERDGIVRFHPQYAARAREAEHGGEHVYVATPGAAGQATALDLGVPPFVQRLRRDRVELHIPEVSYERPVFA
jgi:hypothetical protein